MRCKIKGEINYELWRTIRKFNANLKATKEATNGAVKYFKNLSKDLESGDLKDLKKSIEIYKDCIENQKNCLNAVVDIVNKFDEAEYFNSGDFAKQLISKCKEENIDVYGTAPIFEVFPYRVKIDSENQDLYLDRKKITCMRPKAFVETLKTGLEKLNKANFNASAFLEELHSAYELALLKQGKKNKADLLLNNIYKIMVPMARSRKEYDQQSFAFDIARLYRAQLNGEIETCKDGSYFQFGPSKNNNQAIRILDKDNREVFLATIKFYE